MAAVSQRDVAAVAAHILAEPQPHANRGYDVIADLYRAMIATCTGADHA